MCFSFFFFNDTATTEIYTLSLHDALPISCLRIEARHDPAARRVLHEVEPRSEEHTSELQSPCNLVCRLLLEKKKKNIPSFTRWCFKDLPSLDFRVCVLLQSDNHRLPHFVV